jgi:ArsR family transcriptional regulator
MPGNEFTAKLFKALMHPARLEILDILRDGEECVCHLETMLGYRQAYISQQLMVLREAGLVADRRDGWNMFYRVTDTQVYALIDAARRMTGDTRTAIRRMPAKVAPCPCPRCNPAVAGAAG